jgi:hypothetical protein
VPAHEPRVGDYQGAVADADDGGALCSLCGDPGEQHRIIRFVHRRNDDVVGAGGMKFIEARGGGLWLHLHSGPQLQNAWLRRDTEDIGDPRASQHGIGNDEVSQFGSAVLADDGN